jgi:hypothetical protein
MPPRGDNSFTSNKMAKKLWWYEHTQLGFKTHLNEFQLGSLSWGAYANYTNVHGPE